MLVKRVIMFAMCLSLCLMLTASGESSFTNDIRISGQTIDFAIHEYYSGNDSREFKESLDINEDGFVNSSETEFFFSSFQGKKLDQYRGYVIADDGNTDLSMDSFDIELNGEVGEVDTSDMSVTVSINYRTNSSFSRGNHNIWILGHPSINHMSITLPEDAQLHSYDGLDNSSVSVENDRIILEGVSGIRSFNVDDRLTYEYAVSMDIRNGFFLADMSVFSFLYS